MDSGFIRRADRFERGPLGRVWSTLSGVTTWLAVFCLYIQLAAAATCMVGAPIDTRIVGLDQGLFPICHARANNDVPGQTRGGDRSPAHQQSCPFCSIHCHAAAVGAPTIGVVLYPAVSARVDPPLFAIQTSARFPAGAPPRGPPIAS